MRFAYWPRGHHRAHGPAHHSCGHSHSQHPEHAHPAADAGWGWGGFPFMPRGFDEEGLGAAFGVRRPLRFLAHKLDLDERQIGDLARILDELKTERAQAEVDNRRTLAEFADALAGESFDAPKAATAGDRRVTSATRVRDAVVRALQQIHAILNPEQRGRLAYLIRTGTLQV